MDRACVLGPEGRGGKPLRFTALSLGCLLGGARARASKPGTQDAGFKRSSQVQKVLPQSPGPLRTAADDSRLRAAAGWWGASFSRLVATLLPPHALPSLLAAGSSSSEKPPSCTNSKSLHCRATPALPLFRVVLQLLFPGMRMSMNSGNRGCKDSSPTSVFQGVSCPQGGSRPLLLLLLLHCFSRTRLCATP